MEYKVITFYRYTNIEAPDALRDTLKKVCERHNLLGRILLGKEGINGACCGETEHIEACKEFLRELFKDLTFREQSYHKQTYHKLVIRTREEILGFKQEVNLNNKGNHIPPEELKRMLDNNEDIVLLDARNDYEYEVGKFKNAITLPIKTFTEFPEKVKEIEHLKNKKIVMYCTGGIRCEKSSAYLKEHGFKDVNQLQGGIINYNNTCNDDHWEGGCFVFDDRKVSTMNNAISTCTHCKNETDAMENCHNLDCDELFVICKDCQKTNTCCSEACKSAPRQRKQKTHIYATLGVVENYYVKPKIALVKLNKQLKKGAKVHLKGRNTKLFETTIAELRNYDGKEVDLANKGEHVTFPLDIKVRKNDTVVLVA